MDTRAHISPQALLSQADFIHALARSLLRDAHAAEDVAQEALLTALDRPPRSAASLRAWLARVTRNGARRALRSERRRARREHAGAREEALVGPEQVLERETARAAVVRALLEVPEPSRTALVLHYYEGLSARAIAARLDEPLETVRTRIRRGLARMRARLAQSEEFAERGWMRALAPLAAARGGSAALSAAGAAASTAAVPAAFLASLPVQLGVALGLALLALVAWRSSGGAPEPGPIEGPIVEPLSELEERDGEAAAPLPPADHATGERERERGRATAVLPARGAGRPAAPAADGVEFLALFVRPDREPFELQRATLELAAAKEAFDRPAAAALRVVEMTEPGSRMLVADLVPALYTVRVLAPGVVHRAQVVNLSDVPDGDARGVRPGEETPVEERLVLWPPGWVAIVVRTPDGRPLEAIADELGLEPARVFVDAFHARTRLDPPDGDAFGPREAPEPARFHAPFGYRAWELAGSVVGSLELHEPPPLWVGLTVHGVPLGWELLPPGTREVVFRLDAASFASGLASVALHVVDAPAGTPPSDARVTLKADTSAHRREDQSRVAPDATGRVSLERVVPGRYELAIEGGGALHQQRLELAPGEHRDLGEIVLAPSFAVPLRVVESGGQPVHAWIEIAPLEAGARAEDLFPPNLHRHTDSDGTFSLPMPSGVSIVRATRADPRSGQALGARSANVRLDPDQPPAGTLELTLHERREVRFHVPARAGSRVEVLDELDVVVASLAAAEGNAPECRLVPGRYRARVIDAKDEVLGEETFDVAGADRVVALP